MLAIGSLDKIVRLLDIDNGHILHELPGHENDVFNVCFSRDGRKLISASLDSTLRIWAIASFPRFLMTLDGHQVQFLFKSIPTSSRVNNPLIQDYLWGADTTRSGEYVVSGGRAGTFRIWDIETGDALASIKGHRNSGKSD